MIGKHSGGTFQPFVLVRWTQQRRCARSNCAPIQNRRPTMAFVENCRIRIGDQNMERLLPHPKRSDFVLNVELRVFDGLWRQRCALWSFTIQCELCTTSRRDAVLSSSVHIVLSGIPWDSLQTRGIFGGAPEYVRAMSNRMNSLLKVSSLRWHFDSIDGKISERFSVPSPVCTSVQISIVARQFSWLIAQNRLIYWPNSGPSDTRAQFIRIAQLISIKFLNGDCAPTRPPLAHRAATALIALYFIKFLLCLFWSTNDAVVKLSALR